MTDSISITRPDDWHLHVRDGDVLADVVPHTADRFHRAIIMPNLVPPVVTVDQAHAYRGRIMQAIGAETVFDPLMTLYLTDNTSTDEVFRAAEDSQVYAVKYYPAGATTNANSGVTRIDNVFPALEAMAESGLPLLVHGESNDPAVDVFDREAVFIENTLGPLLQKLPSLRVVLEHVTTQQGVEFVRQGPENLAATITAHHLLLDRNALFRGGLNPHHYCLPILKREHHREALLDAATSGDPSFFLGTDSAPHPRLRKESACGCAGIYTAHAAIELYAEAFDQAAALNRLEAFASFHGPDFYQLPRNRDSITLTKTEWTVPERYPLGDETLVPFRASGQIHWQVTDA